MSFLEGGPLVPLVLISGDSSTGFQSHSGFYLIYFFVEVNVLCIPLYPPLVLHMLTSWWPAAQPVTSTHASVEMRLGSDLNGHHKLPLYYITLASQAWCSLQTSVPVKQP